MATRRLLTTTTTATLRRFTTATATRHLSLLRTLPATSHSTLPTLPPSSRRLFSIEHASNNNKPNCDCKKKVFLDGRDLGHWIVVMDPPPKDWTTEQILYYYIKTLATVVGSEDEARMNIYFVSTTRYFAFRAVISEKLIFKLRGLEKVRWVIPDSDVKNEGYEGEPFININGQAVSYDDLKYHEEWFSINQVVIKPDFRPWK